MLAAILVICGATVLTSCNKDDDNTTIVTPPAKEYFTLWNQCEALTALQDYVKDVTDPASANFIPVEDRIATFDMDGTFVGELYPSYFEYNLLEFRALDDATYEAPKDVMETAQEIRDFVRTGKKLPDHFDMKHAYAAAKAYSGMTLAEFDAYVKAYAQQPANGFTGMTYGESFYKPMLEVFEFLKDNGFTYYVVSGSDRFICRALVESIGIPSNRVIGMDVKLRSTSQGTEEGVNYTMGREEDLVRTDELIIKNLKTNKVLQISQEIGKVPVLSFGNSGGDAAMHNYALGNQKYKSAAFMLIADDDQRDHANREKALTLGEQWRTAGYHVISMRDDFKTIYGEGVTKTDFVFSVNDDKQPTIERITERGKLLVGTTGDYRPLSYLENDGNYWGFGIEMAQKIAERIGVDIEFAQTSWPTLTADVLAAPLLNAPFTHGEIGVLMRKGQDDLLALVNSIIAQMKADGTLRQLHEKYGLVYGY